MKNILTEHYLNLWSEPKRSKYLDRVWHLCQKSYEKIGGFKSASTKEDLMHKTHFWKLVQLNGDIVAGFLYKDQYGRKAIACFTNGSQIGKKALVKLIVEDIHHKRSWGEYSGATEHMTMKLGGTPIPNKYASLLTGKHIDELDPDGFHYIRIIHGTPVKKIIIGHMIK